MMLIFVVVSLVAFSSVTQSVKDEWISFKKKHRKSYYSRAEENLRRSIFEENVKFIKEHNAMFKAGVETYYLKMNHLGDMLVEEANALLGLNRNYSNILFDLTEKPVEFISYALPESVDWRKKGAVTRVKSQGSCGACWAFSAIGSVEGQLFKKTSKRKSLSEQQLIDCNRNLNKGCKGGSVVNAFQYLMDTGLESQKTYPYEARDGQCRFEPWKVVKGTKVRSWFLIPYGNIYGLHQAVATVGPISILLNAANKSFKFSGGGVFNGDKCDPSYLNHGGLLVGYGSKNRKDYWIVKNSWGRKWGEKGYIKFARDWGNTCGIASGASYPLL